MGKRHRLGQIAAVNGCGCREAEITAITNQSTGRKLQIVYGNVTASINPEQITEVLPGNVVAKQLQVGSTVLAHLHNGHEVEAKITKIVDSVAGRKVHIAFEPYAFKVEEKQIVKEMRGGH